jgi:hypothetical protein
LISEASDRELFEDRAIRAAASAWLLRLLSYASCFAISSSKI